MKKTTTLKALALSMIMTLGLVMPMTAQTDNFFKSNNEEIYENRDETGAGLGFTVDQFGAPLGSGLLIMVAAGAGYAVARRRRSMRKAGTMILALAMILTFTQCKKKIETITQSNQGVYISVKVDSDSRHDINLTNNVGEVSFKPGDFLWVVNGNQVSGALGYAGENRFEGYIDNNPTGAFPNIVLDPNDYLYFCYTSNHNPSAVWGTGLPLFLLNVAYQKDEMHLVCFGQTAEKLGTYTSEELQNLSCRLHNNCALVEFTLDVATDQDVRLVDVYTNYRLDIGKGTSGTYTYTDQKGIVTLYNPSGVGVSSNKRWAILLPGESMTADFVVGNKLYKQAVTIPALTNNGLYIVANNKDVKLHNGESYTYATLGSKSFYMPATKKWIEISLTNIQYNKTTSTYGFMGNQWYTIETSTPVGENYASQNIESLFGWGAWGTTAPYNTSTTNSDYTWTTGSNTIEVAVPWRPMTYDEAIYLFKARGTDDQKLYYAATVDDQHGIVILSDAWSGTVNPTPGLNQNWDNIVADMSTWISTYENKGAVFFPAAGYRYNQYPTNVGSWGGYWLSGEASSDQGYSLNFNGSGDKDVSLWVNSEPKCWGQCIRPVREVTY